THGLKVGQLPATGGARLHALQLGKVIQTFCGYKRVAVRRKEIDGYLLVAFELIFQSWNLFIQFLIQGDGGLAGCGTKNIECDGVTEGKSLGIEVGVDESHVDDTVGDRFQNFRTGYKGIRPES